jgi:hypothetical protein
MSINTNIGPERVEVFSKPIGTVLPQGASTAKTAIVISTSLASAPLNTPTSVTSLSQFEQLFGTQANMGEAYLSVKGFYENAGEGSELVIVAVQPSGVSGDKLEEAQNVNSRIMTGTFGALLDNSIVIEDMELTSYTPSTGIMQLDMSSASESDLSKVRKGDLLADPMGRKYTILQVLSGNRVTVEANLDAEQTKAAKSVAPNGTPQMRILRQYASSAYDGKTLVQEGEVYGSLVSITASGTLVEISGFSAILNNVKSGDLIVNASDEVFIITDVIDDNNIVVSRSGLAAGQVTFKRGNKFKIIQTTDDEIGEGEPVQVAPISAEPGKAVFVGLDSTRYPAENAVAGEWLVFDDGVKAKISSNKIIASETNLVAALAGTISYAAATGIVTFPAGTELISDGVVAGDVLIDSNGKEYVIHEVITEESARINKNIASPSPLAGARVNKGAVEVMFASNIDLSAKTIGSSDEDDSGSLNYAGNLLVFSSQENLQSASYFIMEPKTESADYLGSSANFSGLRALDAVDVINLVAIPGIYDPAVQAALIDYCTITRQDCFALVSIPEFITSAATDKLVASNLAISSVQSSANGSIVNFIGSPNLSEISPYDILQIGTQRFVISGVSDEDSQVFLFATAGIPTVGSVAVFSPSAISWKDVVVNKPSIKAAWYYNHLIVVDSNGSNVVVDPVAHVAGVMARVDANIAQGGVSHAPAGIQLAQLAGIVGLQLQISEKLDGGPLRLAFINRITQSPGNGRYIFGGYTAGGASVTPDEQLIQVIRSLLFIKTSLEPGLVGFLWENNSPINRQNIENAVLAFLRANSYLFPAGLPEDQQFRVISQTPSEEDLARGLVKIVVQCRFNTAIRFISIDLSFPLPSSEA